MTETNKGFRDISEEWASQYVISNPSPDRGSSSVQISTSSPTTSTKSTSSTKSIMKVKKSDSREVSFEEENNSCYASTQKVWESPNAPDSVYADIVYPRRKKEKKSRIQSNIFHGLGISTSSHTSDTGNRRTIRSFFMIILFWVITKIQHFLQFLLNCIARKKLAL